jgi:hypothetical protein
MCTSQALCAAPRPTASTMQLAGCKVREHACTARCQAMLLRAYAQLAAWVAACGRPAGPGCWQRTKKHDVADTGLMGTATLGARLHAGDKLAAVRPPQGEPLIGWLSIRPGTALQPSMREAAVTQQLHSHVTASVGRPVPTLLVVLSTQTEHAGATLTLQYK